MRGKTLMSVVGMIAITTASFVYMGKAGLQFGAFEDVNSARMEISDTNGLVVGSRCC